MLIVWYVFHCAGRVQVCVKCKYIAEPELARSKSSKEDLICSDEDGRDEADEDEEENSLLDLERSMQEDSLIPTKKDDYGSEVCSYKSIYLPNHSVNSDYKVRIDIDIDRR